jgi:hypothetical protein
MAIMKTKNNKCFWGCGKKSPHTLLLGMSIIAAHTLLLRISTRVTSYTLTRNINKSQSYTYLGMERSVTAKQASTEGHQKKEQQRNLKRALAIGPAKLLLA